jgi:hypothetical protein
MSPYTTPWKGCKLCRSTTLTSHGQLKVVFDRTTYRKKRTVSPTITVPNRCSLGYDDRELVVRKMLIASGIELKESKTSGAEP